MASMAAAVRRAAQQQGAQQLHALHWPSAIRGGVIPFEAVTSDPKFRLPLLIGGPGHDWIGFQDRRLLAPQTAWNHGTERSFHNRQISQLVSAANNKRAFLVDTLALVNSLPILQNLSVGQFQWKLNSIRSRMRISFHRHLGQGRTFEVELIQCKSSSHKPLLYF